MEKTAVVPDTRTESDFAAVFEGRYLPALTKLLVHKGIQYSGGDKPALVNFHEGSKLAVDSSHHYLMVQATKQWFVLAEWSKWGRRDEVIRKEIVQRLFDIIVYLFLLLFMIEADGEVVLPSGKE